MKGRYLAAALLGALLGVAGVGAQYSATPDPALESFVGTVVYAKPIESGGFLGHARRGLLLRFGEYRGGFEYPWYGEAHAALGQTLSVGARVALRSVPVAGAEPVREVLAIDAVGDRKGVVDPARNLAVRRALAVADGPATYVVLVAFALMALTALFAWLGGRSEEGGGARWACAAWLFGGLGGALLAALGSLAALV